jgi:Uma2 family endonuclease
MNAPILASHWPKARYSVAQIWGLIERGIINHDAKFELLDGEIRPVSPKGPLHESIRVLINRWLATWPRGFDVLAETTLYLNESSFLEPDYVFFDAGLPIEDLTPARVALAIEVAHSSWEYDTTEKASRYAEHGVQEYWAIDAESRLIRIHRGPSAAGWSDIADIAAGGFVSPVCAPEVSFSLK